MEWGDTLATCTHCGVVIVAFKAAGDETRDRTEKLIANEVFKGVGCPGCSTGASPRNLYRILAGPLRVPRPERPEPERGFR